MALLVGVGACAVGESIEGDTNFFSTSVGSSATMTMAGDGDGDGDSGESGTDMGMGDGDGEPGDGDGDPTGQPSVCGDGTKAGDEECDGTDLGGLNCADFGFQDGVLVCANDCTLFTNACSTCGDGQLAATEACDGTNFGGLTCSDLGYVGGVLACAPDCSDVIEAGCMQAPTCGNGVLDVGEACDGGNLGGQTCQSLGYDGGVLSCTQGCQINTSGCTVDECVGLFGACNILFNDCCPGMQCALAFCVPE
ncbi:hypothetical protein [Enhygromyxa salina]|uniref:hypothetical protein n=1 Tax=Enhygromyxa salina TaxID=215803 RepID=UPI0006970C3F|nr:hypothetical protein [Enhygromyxa salina]